MACGVCAGRRGGSAGRGGAATETGDRRSSCTSTTPSAASRRDRAVLRSRAAPADHDLRRDRRGRREAARRRACRCAFRSPTRIPMRPDADDREPPCRCSNADRPAPRSSDLDAELGQRRRASADSVPASRSRSARCRTTARTPHSRSRSTQFSGDERRSRCSAAITTTPAAMPSTVTGRASTTGVPAGRHRLGRDRLHRRDRGRQQRTTRWRSRRTPQRLRFAPARSTATRSRSQRPQTSRSPTPSAGGTGVELVGRERPDERRTRASASGRRWTTRPVGSSRSCTRPDDPADCDGAMPAVQARHIYDDIADAFADDARLTIFTCAGTRIDRERRQPVAAARRTALRQICGGQVVLRLLNSDERRPLCAIKSPRASCGLAPTERCAACVPSATLDLGELA